jgi:hypothetical protein
MAFEPFRDLRLAVAETLIWGRVFGNIGEVDILALGRSLNRTDGKNDLDHAAFLV